MPATSQQLETIVNTIIPIRRVHFQSPRLGFRCIFRGIGPRVLRCCSLCGKLGIRSPSSFRLRLFLLGFGGFLMLGLCLRLGFDLLVLFLGLVVSLVLPRALCDFR